MIPESVHIYGTIRSYRSEVGEHLNKQLHQAANVAESLGGSYQLNITEGEPALFNHPSVNEVIGDMFFLGCGTDDTVSLHQSNFDIDETCLVEGIAILYQSVHLFLQENQ